jgi:hypothetical protein
VRRVEPLPRGKGRESPLPGALVVLGAAPSLLGIVRRRGDVLSGAAHNLDLASAEGLETRVAARAETIVVLLPGRSRIRAIGVSNRVKGRTGPGPDVQDPGLWIKGGNQYSSHGVRSAAASRHSRESLRIPIRYRITDEDSARLVQTVPETPYRINDFRAILRFSGFSVTPAMSPETLRCTSSRQQT